MPTFPDPDDYTLGTVADALRVHVGYLLRMADWTGVADNTQPATCRHSDHTIIGPEWPLDGRTAPGRLLAHVVYAVWLHEIGHIYDGVRYSEDYQRTPFPAEARAWQWAVNHAVIWEPGADIRLRESLLDHFNEQPTETNDRLFQQTRVISAARLFRGRTVQL